MNYYNEIDPFAAAWLRELIKAGHISNGVIDERSIEDVKPSELSEFKQCHFFAGIGVWSYALRLAGWPDDQPVWTGSCPCQPFSAAGKRKGTADERHLWPSMYHLLRECRPVVYFGEQVSSKGGLAWFDIVQTDLEAASYAVGSVDTCAAGFGAPHIRQRLYFVADGGAGELDHPANARHDDTREHAVRSSLCAARPKQPISSGVALGDTCSARLPQRECDGPVQREAMEPQAREAIISGGYTRGFWKDADWLYCRDQKYRPVEPSTFPLAHGVANRVGKLRGYGNAIVAPQAQIFIESYLDSVASQTNAKE